MMKAIAWQNRFYFELPESYREDVSFIPIVNSFLLETLLAWASLWVKWWGRIPPELQQVIDSIEVEANEQDK